MLDEASERVIRHSLRDPIAQNAAIRLVKSLGEGAEEFVSEFADAYIYKQLTGSTDRSWKQVSKDAWYSALIGTLTSAGLNLSADALDAMSPRHLAKTLAADTAERMAEAADYAAGESENNTVSSLLESLERDPDPADGKALDEYHQKEYTTFPAKDATEHISKRIHLQQKLDYVWNGENCFIPEKTEFSAVTTIAGLNSDKPIHDVDRLVNVYRINADEWRKRAGRIDSDQYVFDLHWYEAGDGVQREVKLKFRKERRP